MVSMEFGEEGSKRESNPPGQLGRLEPLPIGQGHIKRKERESNPQGSSLDRFRGGCHRPLACPSTTRLRWLDSNQRWGECHVGLTGRSLLPTRVHRNRSVRTAGFEPALSCSRSTRNTSLSYVLHQERPTGVEPVIPPWQGGRLPLHHGRDLCGLDCQRTRAPGGTRTRVAALRVRYPCRSRDQCSVCQWDQRDLNPHLAD